MLHKCKRQRLVKKLLKDKIRGLDLMNINSYYKTTVWYWCKNILIDKRNRLESPNTYWDT